MKATFETLDYTNRLRVTMEFSKHEWQKVEVSMTPAERQVVRRFFAKFENDDFRNVNVAMGPNFYR